VYYEKLHKYLKMLHIKVRNVYYITMISLQFNLR